MKTLGVISGAVLLSMIASSARAEDLTGFVHRVHMNGISYEEALRFDAAKSVPALLAMLQDPKEEQAWPNVMVMLGILGDDRAVAPMINFLEADAAKGGALSRDHYVVGEPIFSSLVSRRPNQR